MVLAAALRAPNVLPRYPRIVHHVDELLAQRPTSDNKLFGIFSCLSQLDSDPYS